MGIALDIGDLGAGTSIGDLVEAARAVEAAGFGSLWLGESYPVGRPGFHIPHPLLALCRLAGETSLQLGTGVLLMNAWPVEQLAYAGAVADRLCDGRLSLGLAAGDAELAARLRGAAAMDGAAVDRFLQRLRTAWSVGDDAVVPRPGRPGGPGLLVGGRRSAAARRAALLADGWYGSSTYTEPLVARQADAYRRALPPGRRARVVLNRLVLVRDSETEAHAEARRYVVAAVERYRARGSIRGDGSTAASVRATVDDLALVGTSDTLRERLADLGRVGVTEVQLRVRILGMPWPVAAATLDVLSRSDLGQRQRATTADPRRRSR